MKIKKFQMGGEMPAPEGQPMPPQGGPEQGGDPLMQIAQVAAEALQTQNCEAAMAVCEAFMMLMEQAQGGQPEVGAPVEEPVFKKGGKMKKPIKKEGGGTVKKGKDLNLKVELTKSKDKKY